MPRAQYVQKCQNLRNCPPQQKRLANPPAGSETGKAPDIHREARNNKTSYLPEPFPSVYHSTCFYYCKNESVWFGPAANVPTSERIQDQARTSVLRCFVSCNSDLCKLISTSMRLCDICSLGEPLYSALWSINLMAAIDKNVVQLELGAIRLPLHMWVAYCAYE